VMGGKWYPIDFIDVDSYIEVGPDEVMDDSVRDDLGCVY
jgi:hypothetical protein